MAKHLDYFFSSLFPEGFHIMDLLPTLGFIVVVAAVLGRIHYRSYGKRNRTMRLRGKLFRLSYERRREGRMRGENYG